MQNTGLNERTAHWPAIFSLFMGVTSLIAAEFIPVSLLTPIAKDLSVTEGMAGQTVTAVGIFAVITSLLLAPLTRNIDRRLILLLFSMVLIVSNLMVALASSYWVMLIARGMLGICVGGFWSMASAVTLQLVPLRDVPRALSIVYAGVSVATILSLPLASYLGHLVGWRNVFHLAALMGVVAFFWQLIALPPIPARPGNDFRSMFRLLGTNWVLAGIGGTVCSFGGYHMFFTYLRPYLEHDLALPPTMLSMELLAFGIANCLGTFVAGLVFGKRFRTGMLAVHLALVVLAIALLLGSGFVKGDMVLAVAWGFVFGFIPVGWSTWITRTLTDKAEIAGGLSVAAIQLSIGLAAGIGGLAFDRYGINSIFMAAAGFQFAAILFIKISFSCFSRDTGRLA